MAKEPRIPRCGRLLRQARRRYGLGQRSLAARAGTTQAAISRIERDEVSPSLTTVNRLFEAMGETLIVGSTSLDAPPPGGGNATVRELRGEYERSTPEQRLAQAAELSRIQTKLAAGTLLKPDRLVHTLVKHEVEFIVVGAFAVAAHGHPRGTGAIDICPDPNEANLRRLAGALRELEAESMDAGGNWTLKTRYGRLDVMQYLEGLDHGYADLAPHAEERDFVGRSVRFCSYEDLLRMKEATGRDQDLIDIRSLRAARGELG
jgi:transcriptional regulator with XRE-family HTH domain